MPQHDSTASKTDPANDVDISGAWAAVTWPEQAEPLRVTCDIRRIASDNAASFKLRAVVALKPPGFTRTSLYLFVRPERIRTLAHDNAPDLASQGPVPRLMGQQTSSLRFLLDEPAVLVGPACLEKMAPKTKKSADVLHQLRALCQKTEFTIHLPGSLSSEAQLASLCEAASAHELKTITWQADLGGLYRGSGGRIMEVGSEAFGPGLPACDEVGAAPPAPPTSNESSDQGPSKKRRRRESDDSDAPHVDTVAMEAMCRKLMGEVKAELQVDMRCHVQKLEATIMDRLEQRLGQESDRIMQYVDEQLMVGREETTQEIGSRIEDEYYGVRLRLEEYVQQEVLQAEERVVEHIESNATLYIEFNTT